MMPSPYSSDGHRRRRAGAGREPRRRAARAADRASAMARLRRAARRAVFAGREPDITEENLQARIRGNLLMALSNKFGWLVLTTGNKSEMSVGYSTLYGDSAGGFAVIKDVPKPLVYRLVAPAQRARPARADPRSRSSTRPPSAELRPDQRDDDSLPPYEVLDAILEGYVEEDLGPRAARRPRPAGRRRRPRHPRSSTSPSTSAARTPPGHQGHDARPSAATGACRSRTATAASAARRSGGPRSSSATSAQRRSSSSVISTSQTQVVRPRWRRGPSRGSCPRGSGAGSSSGCSGPAPMLPSAWTAEPGAHRGERLGDRGEDAAVDEAGRLLVVVGDVDVRADRRPSGRARR